MNDQKNTEYLDKNPLNVEERLRVGICDAWRDISKIYNLEITDDSWVDEIVIEHPANENFGDYSTNIAMYFAKKYKVNPMEVGNKIKEKLESNNDLKPVIESVTFVAPGFINITLQEDFLVECAKEILDIKNFKEKLSKVQPNRKILIEHTSPNTNKSLHIGHLRNNLLGMALVRLLRTVGNKVVVDCLYNDRGIHICKAMWGYLKNDNKEKPWKTVLEMWADHQSEWPAPQSLNLKPDHFVEHFYGIGVKSEDDENNKNEMKEMLLAWESGDKNIRDLWSKLNKWVYEGFALTYKAIGSAHDNNWYESEFYREAKKEIDDGLQKGIFKKLDDGAILTDLATFGLTDNIVQRSDGTSMYFTQDIYLTKLKKEKFICDNYIWVVGPEQQLHLKQVFAVCEQLGISKRDDLLHLWYGYVFLKNQGKMSSRNGTVVSIDSLIEESTKRSLDLVEKNLEKRGKSTQVNKEDIARKVGVSAVKYAILKVDKHQDIDFDWDEALDIKGNCGPYIQYTYTRCFSVLKKKKASNTNEFEIIGELVAEEESLLRTFYKLPEVVILAAKSYAPHYVAQYLYEISQKYNSFYEKCHIVGSDNESFRLFLTDTTAQIIKFGLELLGIEEVESM